MFCVTLKIKIVFLKNVLYIITIFSSPAVQTMTLQWLHPFTSLVSGPTGAGKTWFVKEFIQNLDAMVDVTIHEILWFYGEKQSFHNNIKEISPVPIDFIQGMPELEKVAAESSPPPRLVVIDDLMVEGGGGKVIDFFTKGSHHRNLSVIFLLQNIFHQGKAMRDVSLNSHYIVLFKNPRENAQVGYLARQIDPQNSKFIQESYADATSMPHSYFLIDMKQSTPDYLRYRNNIFPNLEYTNIYIPIKKLKEYGKYFAIKD